MGYYIEYKFELTFKNKKAQDKAIVLLNKHTFAINYSFDDSLIFDDWIDGKFYDGFEDLVRNLTPYVEYGEITTKGQEGEKTEYYYDDDIVRRDEFELRKVGEAVISCVKDCTKCVDYLKSLVGECKLKVV